MNSYRALTIAAVAAIALVTAAPAAADPPDPKCGWNPDLSAPMDLESPSGGAVLQATYDDVNRQLGKPAHLSQDGINIADPWVFVGATILGRDGKPIDYTGTPFEQGSHSKKYFALLRHDELNAWTLVDSRVGPSDAVDEGWPEKHGSPPVFWRCT